MFKNLCRVFLCLYLLAVPLRAESLFDFNKRLPTDFDMNFMAANVRDLSVYQTWSRWQDPTGWCQVFSFIGGVEAAYTRTYCNDTNSAFYKAGYCERYQALKAANMPSFYLANSANWYFQFDKKDLDLSELYYVDRALTSWTTSASSNHETGNPICHLNGLGDGVAGSASLLLSQIRLPEEKQAEHIYDPAFYATAVQNIFSGNCDASNPSQEVLDTYEYSDKKIDFKYWDYRPMQRAFIPFEARRRASFGVSNVVVGDASTLSNKIRFLEKCIFSKFEVAVHGAQKSHSMLLIGYDRNREKFLYKDNYHQFVEVDYAVTRDNMSSFDIIVEPFAGWETMSREEMWVGPWDVMLDGHPGSRLVIRRTRLAPNVLFSSDDLYNENIQPLSTTLWARLGTFYENDSSKHIVYGRLDNSGGDTMELIVDFDHPEPPPPSGLISSTPAGNRFSLRMFKSGDGAGAYAEGNGEWQGKTVGILMKRPGQNPYGLIPRTPATSFIRSKWLGRFLVRFEEGQVAYLDLNSEDNLQTLTGTLQNVPGSTGTVTGTFVSDNEIVLSVKFGSVISFSFRLFYHSGDDRVISGTYNSALTQTRAAFGYRMVPAGDTGLHARMFFPYYDLATDGFNAFAVTNVGTSTGIAKFSAFTNAGVPAIAPRNPGMMYLPASYQMARLATEVFGAKLAGASQSYWVELESNSTQIGTFAQFGNGVQMLDGAVPWSGLAKEMYFSRVYQGNGAFRGRSASTILAIANPGDAICQVRFDLIGPDGQTTGHSQPYLFGPKRVLQRELSAFFGEELGTVSEGYIRVRVESGEGVVAAAVVRLANSTTTFSLNALYPESSLVLYSAQIARTPGYFTNISLINSSDVTRKITIRGISDTGTSLGTPKTITLLAGTTCSGDVAALLSLAYSAEMLGSLKVEADGPGVLGDVVFGDPSNLGYVAALPLQGSPFTKALFSHVANGLGYFTGLAIYNPSDSSTNVAIKIYTKDGVLVGQKVENLGPGARLSKLLPEFVSASAGQLGGYVVVESSAGVVAQELFASGNLNFLSSVPPAVLE